MLFLFEEIAVEVAMIVATLAAVGVLVYVLAGFALEHARARQESAPDRSFAPVSSHASLGRHA